MIRVYCKECKYLDVGHNRTSDAYACSHPSTVMVVVTNDWFEGTTATLSGDPKELNKDNNCQYYEDKNES